jgi:uncharacterized protein
MIIRRRHLIAGAILCGASGLISPRVEAQSFDCKQASTAVERTICEDKSLASLDNELLYRVHDLISMAPSQRAFILLTERRWIVERDDLCNKDASEPLSSCLHWLYASRIEELRNLIEIRRELPPPDDAALKTLFGVWSGDYGPTAVPFQVIVGRHKINEDDEGHQLHCQGMSYAFLGKADGQYFLAVSAPRKCLLDTNDPPKYFVFKPDVLTFRACSTARDILKLVRNPNDGSVYCGELRLIR